MEKVSRRTSGLMGACGWVPILQCALSRRAANVNSVLMRERPFHAVSRGADNASTLVGGRDCSKEARQSPSVGVLDGQPPHFPPEWAPLRPQPSLCPYAGLAPQLLPEAAERPPSHAHPFTMSSSLPPLPPRSTGHSSPFPRSATPAPGAGGSVLLGVDAAAVTKKMAVTAAARRAIAASRARREATARAVELALRAEGEKEATMADARAVDATTAVPGGAASGMPMGAQGAAERGSTPPVPAAGPRTGVGCPPSTGAPALLLDDSRGPAGGADCDVPVVRAAARVADTRPAEAGCAVVTAPRPAVRAAAGVRGTRPADASFAVDGAAGERPSPAVASGLSSSGTVEAPDDVGDDTSGRRGKGKGKGKVWNLEERVALCKAFAVATLNSASGSDQTPENFWKAVYNGFVGLTPTNVAASKLKGRWADRPVGSAQTEFQRNVGPSCQRYAHFYFIASSDDLTGNLDEEGVKRAARGLYSATSAYDAARKDGEEEDARATAGMDLPERRPRMPPDNWGPCCDQLRVLDKWSGAAADPEIEVLYGAHACVDGAAKRPGKGKRPPLQQNLMGNKAAKRQARGKAESIGEEDGLLQALESSNEAIKTMVSSISKRAAACEAAQRAEDRRMAAEYFNREGVRDTPEALEFRSNLHQEMVRLGRSVLSTALERRTDSSMALPGRAASPSAGTPASSDSGHAADRRAAISLGARAMATKKQNALLRQRVIDLTMSSTTLGASNARVAAPAAGSDAGGSAARVSGASSRAEDIDAGATKSILYGLDDSSSEEEEEDDGTR